MTGAIAILLGAAHLLGSPSLAAQDGMSRRVTLGEAASVDGHTVTPVVIDDASDLLAGDIDLLFDGDGVEVLEVRAGGLLGGFFLLHNAEADTLRVSFASTLVAVQGAGTLLEIVTSGSSAPELGFLRITLNAATGEALPVDYERVGLAEDTTAVRSAVTDDLSRSPPTDGLRAYPNPFNGQTILAVTVARAQPISLRIYNGGGQAIRVLAAGTYAPGTHTFRWDGIDAQGRPAASGRYVAHLRTPARRASVSLTLVR